MGQSRGPLQNKASSSRRQSEEPGHRCGWAEPPTSGRTEIQAWETRPAFRGRSRVINKRPNQGSWARRKWEQNVSRKDMPVHWQGRLSLTVMLLCLCMAPSRVQRRVARGQGPEGKAVTPARVVRTGNSSVHCSKCIYALTQYSWKNVYPSNIYLLSTYHSLATVTSTAVNRLNGHSLVGETWWVMVNTWLRENSEQRQGQGGLSWCPSTHTPSATVQLLVQLAQLSGQ